MKAATLPGAERNAERPRNAWEGRRATLLDSEDSKTGCVICNDDPGVA